MADKQNTTGDAIRIVEDKITHQQVIKLPQDWRAQVENLFEPSGAQPEPKAERDEELITTLDDLIKSIGV